MRDPGPSIERNWRSNLLSCHVLPPVLREVLSDVNGAVLDMPPCAQVKGELQLFERAATRLRHEEIHEEEGDDVEPGEDAQASGGANAVRQDREDQHQDSRSHQIDGHGNCHTDFS